MTDSEKDFDPKPGDDEIEVKVIMEDLIERIKTVLLDDKEVNELTQLVADCINEMQQTTAHLDSRSMKLLKHVIRTTAATNALERILSIHGDMFGSKKSHLQLKD